MGISIGKGTKGGIFVTLVNDNSVAGAAGLQYGDQLLEVSFGDFGLDSESVLSRMEPMESLSFEDFQSIKYFPPSTIASLLGYLL